MNMSRYRILMRAAAKRQKGSVAGLFLMVFVAMLCVFTALTLYGSGKRSLEEEMERLGFGDFTAWVSGAPVGLAGEIEELGDVGRVTEQPLIFAGYEINGKYSDNDGQLIVYDRGVPYRFLDENGNPLPEQTIEKGTVYISPALRSSFDVEIGDTIQFELARAKVRTPEGEILPRVKSLVVAGYFGDAFMGSSMIDMKSFLICETDREELLRFIKECPEGDVLAKSGAMLHIFKGGDSALDEMGFHGSVQMETELPLYTEFTYSRESILSYMLLLQNILCGFMAVFSVVLLVVCFIAAGKSLSDAIEQDRKDMAVLRTVGLSGGCIRRIYFGLYGGAMLLGLAMGLAFSVLLAGAMARGMVSSTGLLVGIRFPAQAVFCILALLVILFVLFLYWKTGDILRIAPIQAIREASGGRRLHTKIGKRFLAAQIAVRELLAHTGKYAGLCVISALLVLFLSVIGRMGAWLGANGEGLMNAFSVADHDLGVQPFNAGVPMDEIERIINWYSPVRETYELAMESVTINGYETTANVLNDTDYFHVLEGRVCDGEGVLITYTIASELGLAVGDTVQIAGRGRRESYTVTGIYQCANGMGNNIGMSMAGYSKIGNINGYIWCYHYILENGAVRDYAMKYLQDSYQGIDVHTNSWSGLDGIVSLMHGLIWLIYLVAALFILVVVALSTGKLLQAETGNMAVYKSLGLSNSRLRLSFSLRFLIAVTVGALAGGLAAGGLADPLIGAVFRMFGIGEFTSRISLTGTLLPLCLVPVMFFGAAWLFSGKLKRVSIVRLVSENED